MIKEKEDGRIEGRRKRKKGQEGEIGREVCRERRRKKMFVEGTMVHLTLLLSILNPVYTYTTQILLFCFFISSLEMVPRIEAI